MHPAVTRIAILMVLSLLCGAASAQGDAARAKRWEFSLQLPDVQGKNYSFEGGSSARTSNTLGFGVGFAYNLSNHLNLGMDFNWYSMDFDATIQPGVGTGQAAFTTRGTADVSSVMFNATYHFLSGPVTPYVAAGIGGTYVDSNIQTGPAVPVCWYYPWYGYYCGTAVPTASNNFFSYAGGAGLRWDVSRQMFLRAGATRQWLDASGNSSSDGTTTWRIDFGFKN
jgi:opacity protein-like surface antigen